MSSRLPFLFPASNEDITTRRARILTRLLSMDEGFRTIPVRSVRRSTLIEMLRLYDEIFLGSYIARSYQSLEVTLSTRMTSCAGKFIFKRIGTGIPDTGVIRMSGDFLFRLKKGPFELNGLRADTPQEAFLIVFEHELCHAIEAAIDGKPGHSKRFMSLAGGLFGHTAFRHSLPTQKSEAVDAGFRVGCRVAFPYQGERLVGVISSLGRTASVMIPDRNGAYTDRAGRRYARYSVPYSRLEPVNSSAPVEFDHL